MQKPKTMHIEKMQGKTRKLFDKSGEEIAWECELEALDEKRGLLKKGWTEALAYAFQTEYEVIARFYLPEVDEEYIELDVRPEAVKVKAVTKTQKYLGGKEHAIERKVKKSYKFLTLPAKIDPERVKYSLKNNVLEVKMTKAGLWERMRDLKAYAEPETWKHVYGPEMNLTGMA